MNMLSILRNEEGSALIVALLLLVLLTLIGIAATTTTTTDMQIASNERSYKLAFFAAEAAKDFVAGSPNLYGAGNVSGVPQSFAMQVLSSNQSFDGTVQYLDSIDPPAGSGYEVGKFKAHRYKMICSGYGPRNAESRIEAGFYRIGF